MTTIGADPGASGGARTLLLLGGKEWHPECRPADSWWLSRARRAEVVVVTSAAQDVPHEVLIWARDYFRDLGAKVSACHVQTAADAGDPERLKELAGAAAIYLCGGDPEAACEVLQGSPAGLAICSAYQNGVPLAGSSAGAMVLASACLLPGQGFRTRPGLGLFPGTFLPHWNSVGRRWKEAARQLSREQQVLVVDESTGACWDGAAWSVRGPGQAQVLGPDDQLDPTLNSAAVPLQ